MNSTWRIASGVSVLFTTLAFAHIVFHNTLHMVNEHGANLFVALHTVVAVLLVILSLAGAFCLLRSKRQQNPN